MAQVPLAQLDTKYRYNVVKGAELIGKSDCVHNMRKRAKFRKAQLWRIQQFGAPLLVDDFGR